jgi:hypothetical protein
MSQALFKVSFDEMGAYPSFRESVIAHRRGSMAALFDTPLPPMEIEPVAVAPAGAGRSGADALAAMQRDLAALQLTVTAQGIQVTGIQTGINNLRAGMQGQGQRGSAPKRGAGGARGGGHKPSRGGDPKEKVAPQV